MARKVQKKKKLILRKKLKTIAWFLIKFNLLAIPLYLLIYFNISYVPLQGFIAAASVPFIKMFGHSASLVDYFGCDAPSVSGPDFQKPVCISWDSTGWKSMYALAALVIAAPVAGWKGKLRFLAAGIPLIFLINYLRIVTTILIALNFGWRYFELVHTVLWREGLIIAVVLIWYLWLRRQKKI